MTQSLKKFLIQRVLIPQLWGSKEHKTTVALTKKLRTCLRGHKSSKWEWLRYTFFDTS